MNLLHRQLVKTGFDIPLILCLLNLEIDIPQLQITITVSENERAKATVLFHSKTALFL